HKTEMEDRRSFDTPGVETGPGVAFAAKAPVLAVANATTVRFYAGEQLQEDRPAIKPGSEPTAFALSPDGKTLGVARTNRVSIYDTTTGKPTRPTPFEDHPGTVFDMCFSSDGRF